MPNDFFRFKEFTIYQQHCAMKVCTDASLFGAWTANLIACKNLPVNTILDIGAGTGLLSLMLAQQCSSSLIHAVETDAAAAHQAGENFNASPWQQRLHIFNTAIQQFSSPVQYDFIIANPPFFQNDLPGNNAKRNIALHSHQLTLEELLNSMTKHLSATGYFAVLLPAHRSAFFEKSAQQESFYLQAKTLVQQTPAHSGFRSMLLFGKTSAAICKGNISIKSTTGNYTAAFAELLKAYYLYL